MGFRWKMFLPKITQTLKPLTSPLKGSSKLFKWSKPMSEAFSAPNQALVSATVLIHPNLSAQLSLAMDESDTHVEAMLQQFHNGGWAPLSFFSKQLDSTQSKYSAFEMELLAVYLAIHHFRYMLEGHKFHIQTDHKPLIHGSPPCIKALVYQPNSCSILLNIHQITLISLVWIMQ